MRLKPAEHKVKPTLKSPALAPAIAVPAEIVTGAGVPLLIVAVIDAKPPTDADRKVTGFGEIAIAVDVPVPLIFAISGLPDGPV